MLTKVPVNNPNDLEKNNDESSDHIIIMHRGYSRPKIVNHNDDDLSDYVKFRLGLARVLALKKYRKIHGAA